MKKIVLSLSFIFCIAVYASAQLNPPPLTNYQVLKGNIDSLIAGDVLVVRNAATVNGNALDVVMKITGIFAPYKYANGSNGIPSRATFTFGGTDHGTGIYDNLRFVGVNIDKNPWVTYTLHFAEAGTATSTNLSGIRIVVSNVESYLPYLSGPAYDATLPGRKYSNIAGVKAPMVGTVAAIGGNLENKGFFDNPLQYGSPVYPDITDVPPPVGFNMFRDNEVDKSTGIITTPFAPVYGDPSFTVKIDYDTYPAEGIEYIFGISNNPANPNSDTCDFAPNRTMYVTFVTTDTSVPLSAKFSNLTATLDGSVLTTSWRTLSETNSDYFNVEISANGKEFKKIQQLKTKASEGSSSVPLTYEISISNATTGLMAVLGIVLLAGGMFNQNKKRKLSFALIAICVLSSALILGACNKNNDKVNVENNKALFVRIQQVDKDGKTSYSDIVKVKTNN